MKVRIRDYFGGFYYLRLLLISGILFGIGGLCENEDDAANSCHYSGGEGNRRSVASELDDVANDDRAEHHAKVLAKGDDCQDGGGIGCAGEGVGTHREEVGGNEAGDEAHGDEKERRGGVSVPLCGDAVANC